MRRLLTLLSTGVMLSGFYTQQNPSAQVYLEEKPIVNEAQSTNYQKILWWKKEGFTLNTFQVLSHLYNPRYGGFSTYQGRKQKVKTKSITNQINI